MALTEEQREYQREWKRKRRLDPEFRKRELEATLRWMAKHPEFKERQKAQKRNRYASDAEFREMRKETERLRRRNDPSYRRRERLRGRRRRLENPVYAARIGLLAQEWNMRNRERYKEFNRVSKARRAAAAEAEMNEIIAEIQGATDV